MCVAYYFPVCATISPAVMWGGFGNKGVRCCPTNSPALQFDSSSPGRTSPGRTSPRRTFPGRTSREWISREQSSREQNRLVCTERSLPFECAQTPGEPRASGLREIPHPGRARLCDDEGACCHTDVHTLDVIMILQVVTRGDQRLGVWVVKAQFAHHRGIAHE